MEATQKFIVAEENENIRLDAFLVKQFPHLSRARIQRAVAKGEAKVNDKKAKSSLRLAADDIVEFTPPAVVSEAPVPEDISLDILFEDESMVAINKPPAMVVHPAKGNWKGTLTSALAFHFQQLSDLGGVSRPGIVHRLDRDTSGVILVAKTNQAHASLSKQFELRTVSKTYWALVSPAPDRDRDVIDQPIGAHPYQREKKAIRLNHATSKSAQSFYEVQRRFQGFSVVHVAPKTGRTHQIRVHMAHVGCPVVCDKLYSGRSTLRICDVIQASDRSEGDPQDLLLDRQALHAMKIEFDHPLSGERVTIEAPLPDDLKRTLAEIERRRGET